MKKNINAIIVSSENVSPYILGCYDWLTKNDVAVNHITTIDQAASFCTQPDEASLLIVFGDNPSFLQTINDIPCTDLTIIFVRCHDDDPIPITSDIVVATIDNFALEIEKVVRAMQH